ncbi:hypothetical protein [Thalassotalea euphylliae]|uniref:Uncharacterized protein n=1 Tax=Thalassotalea euphylliae TaxID=1655234 RepID=A0A3E0UIM8_9GAMM|nr:hypothetical protein [Thalassotalea euphylliae]REL35612.1 hypothetical protein DXX92_09740 [Thalassotalea euphylliae]
MRMKGRVIKGHQVASGKATDSPFSEGTIALQKPFFKKLGLDLSRMFDGTINLAIEQTVQDLVQESSQEPCQERHAELCIQFGIADYRFKNVKWTTDWPAEDFDFYSCEIAYQGKCYSAFIYQPKAETKVGHFQPSNVVELIAPFIEGVSYGDELELLIK